MQFVASKLLSAEFSVQVKCCLRVASSFAIPADILQVIAVLWPPHSYSQKRMRFVLRDNHLHFYSVNETNDS